MFPSLSLLGHKARLGTPALRAAEMKWTHECTVSAQPCYGTGAGQAVDHSFAPVLGRAPELSRNLWARGGLSTATSHLPSHLLTSRRGRNKNQKLTNKEPEAPQVTKDQDHTFPMASALGEDRSPAHRKDVRLPAEQRPWRAQHRDKPCPCLLPPRRGRL